MVLYFKDKIIRAENVVVSCRKKRQTKDTKFKLTIAYKLIT